jgi:hypothetical protein
MTSVLSATISDSPAEQRTPSIQAYARVAGILMVLSMIFGFLGEWQIPSGFMTGEPATMARNIVEKGSLYRFGFAAYLVEACCDIALSAFFYVLLKPVSKPVALTAAFFGLLATAMYAVGEIFYFAPTVMLSSTASYMKAFTPDQVNALVALSLRLFGRVGMIFLGLYGIATFLRGYLIVRSGYVPKVIGVLLMIAGASFVVKNLTAVVAPKYSSNFLLAPMFFAGLPLMIWMLAKGVDVAKWKARSIE